jgi:hypothetical protein
LELNRKKVLIPASITDTGVGLRAHGQKGGTMRGKVRHGCRDGNGALFAGPWERRLYCSYSALLVRVVVNVAACRDSLLGDGEPVPWWANKGPREEASTSRRGRDAHFSHTGGKRSRHAVQTHTDNKKGATVVTTSPSATSLTRTRRRPTAGGRKEGWFLARLANGLTGALCGCEVRTWMAKQRIVAGRGAHKTL